MQPESPPNTAVPRQPWETPVLTAHGSLVEITRAVDDIGPGDGLFSDGPS